MLEYENKGVTVRDSKDYTIKTMEAAGINALYAMDKARKILDHFQITYWIDAGTLLGKVRDYRFIPHDTDIDFGIIMGNDKAQFIQYVMEYESFRLVRKQTYVDDVGKIVMPSQTLYLHEPTGVLVDFYWFYVEDRDAGAVLLNHNECGTLSIPFDLIYPVQDNAYPNQPEAYLAHRFGPDWRTPAESKSAWYEEANNLNK